jgi:uncharacterized protein (TIGR03435 family)
MRTDLAKIRATFAAAGVVWLSALAPSGGTAQEPGKGKGPASPRPFDVVSVRPVAQDRSVPPKLECSPGRFSSTMPLRVVVAFAYGYPAPDIFGVRSWSENSETRYAIEAVADRPVSPDECKSMVQRLLEDRFDLVVRSETRQESVYELIVAKNGPKLREATGPEDFSMIDGVRVRNGLSRKEVLGMTMAMLALALQVELLRDSHLPGGRESLPVVDRTGLTGGYVIRLNFSRRPDDNTRPDLFSALEEQLGLKLQPKRDSREVLFIDRVQEPKPN